MVVTEVWTCLFVYKIIPENIEKLTSCIVNGELFVNIFFRVMQLYLKDKKRNNLYIVQKYAHLLVLGHYLFLKPHIFFKLCSWKTVCI